MSYGAMGQEKRWTPMASYRVEWVNIEFLWTTVTYICAVGLRGLIPPVRRKLNFVLGWKHLTISLVNYNSLTWSFPPPPSLPFENMTLSVSRFVSIKNNNWWFKFSFS